MVATVVPGTDRLPGVLPTERLTANARPVPEVREQLRRIPGGRNAVTVAGAWLQSFGVVAAAAVIDRWWGYLIAFFLMGRAFALLNILAHEAAHRLLFRPRRLNDFVGHRPIAILETRPQGEPYDHERHRPLPLYLKLSLIHI